MDRRAYLRVATWLGVAGVAFSGWLSWTRASSGVCAFAEPCPFFLGHPACYTGLALFAASLAITVAARFAGGARAWPAIANASVGLAGTLFAARMTLEELGAGARYRLGLPTCAYGAIFFFALLVVSAAAWIGRSRPRDLAHR